MDNTIIAALIGFLATLAAVFLSQHFTEKRVIQELEKKMAVVTTNQENIEKHVAEHNNYAKLFSENVPVLKEQYKELDRRMTNIENKLS